MKNNKALGQHWLKDRAVLDAIADSVADMSLAGLCLEIGPGLGTLTSSLLRRFDKVIAVEFDERLAHNLPASFPGKNLEVIHADFLQFDLSSIKEPYVVAGNIPYYITSPIIEKLLTAENKPKKIVLLIQKEVADRILALDSKTSVLSLTVENLAEVEPGLFVPKDYFTPPPKVDSATIILTPREQPLVDGKVIDLVKKAFKQPRKKLSNNLPNLPAEYQNLRPADLSLEDYKKLLNFYA